VHAFNGIARPEYRADVAVFVTNRGFSRVVRDFAARHDIRLVGWDALCAWATWGDPLTEVLDTAPSKTCDTSRRPVAPDTSTSPPA
jgi:hypothetical protein